MPRMVWYRDQDFLRLLNGERRINIQQLRCTLERDFQ